MGADSGVVHLQQSDAEADHHWPFTAAYNAAGRIDARRVLDALAGTAERHLVLEVIPPFEARRRGRCWTTSASRVGLLAGGAVRLERVTEEGERLAVAARDAGLPLVLLGGVAVWLRCPSARRAPLARDYGDADFIGHARDRKAITAFMEEQGYVPDKMFNALHGAARLNFEDPESGRPVDVLLDRFAMCHELDLTERLDGGELTLPLADLLLTKLQVVRLNEKDVLDLFALLGRPRLRTGDRARPHPRRHPRRLGLRAHDPRHAGQAVQDRLPESGLPPTPAADRRPATGSTALAAAPKSARWRMRARVGERKRWYEQPEEARA